MTSVKVHTAHLVRTRDILTVKAKISACIPEILIIALYTKAHGIRTVRFLSNDQFSLPMRRNSILRFSGFIPRLPASEVYFDTMESNGYLSTIISRQFIASYHHKGTQILFKSHLSGCYPTIRFY